MASRSLIILLLAAIAVFLPATAMATKFWVGNKYGWTIDYDYQEWTKDKVFHVGDTLIFIYPKGNDSVYKVNQTEFQSCTIRLGDSGHHSGHDEIPLNSTGKRWYISGAPKHCSEHKQKLVINVVEVGTPAPAPMAPMPPMAPVTPTPSPDSPTSSAYGTQQKSKYQLLFAATLAFAALLMA